MYIVFLLCQKHVPVIWAHTTFFKKSVYITTNVVSSNLAQARCTRYNIMW